MSRARYPLAARQAQIHVAPFLFLLLGLASVTLGSILGLYILH